MDVQRHWTRIDREVAKGGQRLADPSGQHLHRGSIRTGKGEHRPTVTRVFGVVDHLIDVNADIGSQVGLVHQQQVGPADSRSALAGDIAPASDV
jgi:hypothetical protein